MTEVRESKQKAIGRLLEQEGRTQAWLAEAVGVSPNHISQVLAGKRRMTETLHAKILAALDREPSVLDHFAGRVVRVPVSVFRREVSAEAVADSYEEAWKADWVAEHAEATLAAAAQRAFDRSHQIAAATRRALSPGAQA